MENRRQHYRHEFAATRQFVVRLQSPAGKPVLQGEMINLSVGGLCVYAPGLRAEAAEMWLVTLALEAEAEPLSIPVERVHAREQDRAIWSFRFVNDDPQVAEAREQAIWRFLLREQRRRWQFLRGV